EQGATLAPHISACQPCLLPHEVCEHVMSDTIYTSTSFSGSIAFNPHEDSNLILQKYTADYQDTTVNKAPLSHISAHQPYLLPHEALVYKFRIGHC
ncbi:hypothetical protein J3R83DRAFT_10704, partial [Lanmaoa asiatica]